MASGTLRRSRSGLRLPGLHQGVIKIVSPAPIIEFSMLKVACSVPKVFLDSSICEERAAYLAIFDVGAMIRDSLKPEAILKQRGAASKYLCGDKLRIQSAEPHIVEICAEALVFEAQVATLVVCAVIENSSVAGWQLVDCQQCTLLGQDLSSEELVKVMHTIRTKLQDIPEFGREIVTIVDRRIFDFVEKVRQYQKALEANGYDDDVDPVFSAWLHQLKEASKASGGRETTLVSQGLHKFLTGLQDIGHVSSQDDDGCVDANSTYFLAEYGRSLCGFPLLDSLSKLVDDNSDHPVRVAFRKELDELHSELWTKASERDLALLQEATYEIKVATTLPSDPADDCKIEVAEGHGLEPMEEIVVGEDYNRVAKLGSIITFFPLSNPGVPGVDIKRLCIGPAIPATNASSGKTLNFIEQVENFDEALQEEELQSIISEHCRSEDFSFASQTDVEKRKIDLIKSYTDFELYKLVNKAMYTDDKVSLRKFAAYIRELRDVFRNGQSNMVVTCFSGTLRRGMYNVKPEDIKDYAQRFARGQEVCWSSFTSTSDGDIKKAFDGNLKFEIECKPSTEIKEDDYIPASIAEHSQFAEEEVLIPPHSRFRVRNITILEGWAGATIHMEMIGLPCVWKMIEAKQWDEFAHWASCNSKLVDTKHCKFSIINAVARSYAEDPAGECESSNPLVVCIDHGASPNELYRDTEDTPLSTIAKVLREKASGSAAIDQAIKVLIEKGGNPYMSSSGGQSFVEICPEYDLEGLAGQQIRWMYYIGDGRDGKADGWYPYDASASETVETTFQSWIKLGRSGEDTMHNIQNVKSGHFSYNLDFTSMQQTNTTSQKSRQIMRQVNCSADDCE